jgi:hypothetical protein
MSFLVILSVSAGITLPGASSYDRVVTPAWPARVPKRGGTTRTDHASV